ncbi:MAG: TraR/DksA family transcriptional regulator [Planctomycetota bacterium]|jgi:DnaK suppressor protein|nr:TraR/DksA family transcriptional regulator [Planctomycetota bacterium]
MNAEQLRRTLIALRDRMKESQRSIRDGAISDAGLRAIGKAPTNFAEQASDEQEIDLMAERLTASSDTLADIDEAIGRTEEGHFNECEECGKEIGERRLAIKPWARLCVSCQRKFEKEDLS